ncbi:MAG: 50S ribosomal protein L29 [Phycisphaeraceae bacterium]|nr:50S ribosomal protein L29 [Phycisphaeraceae bacterium]
MPIKKEELHKMSDAEIAEESARLRSRLYELRQQAVTEKLENNREPGNIRKDIARLLTEKRSRELTKA